MKLKKIASLALAGVMAVSMLAGCGTDKKPAPNPGEGEGTTSTGYSATLKGAVELTANQAKYISFADNAADAAALKDALGNLGSVVTAATTVLPGYATPIEKDVKNNTTGLDSVDAVIDDFADALDLANPLLRQQGAVDNLINNPALDQDETVKYGMLYVIDGTVDVAKAVKQVAGMVDDELLQKLPNANEETAVHYTYDYTVSVSVVNKPLTTLTNYTGSANFIAVTVTRVPTAA